MHHDHNCGHHHDHCGHDHNCGHHHDHDHDSGCREPMEELIALMKYMTGHNAAHARELAELAHRLEHAGNPVAYEQVMAAVSDFEKGNMRLRAVLADLEAKE